MKKLFIILALAALVPFSINAQDAMNSVPQKPSSPTVWPSCLPSAWRRTITLCPSWHLPVPPGIEAMAAMLVPAADGANATVEYALNGVVDYVTAQGNEAARAQVAAGLKSAIDKCTDNANKAFLMSLLQICATDEDAPAFVKY